MIQLNLIPDVKAKYIKAQHSKRMIVLSSVTISGVALALVFLMATYVYAGQKLRLNGLDGDIKKNSAKLKAVPDLDKILTIQNQLNALTDLHDQKPVTNRLMTFLPQVTPNDVQIATMTVNFDENTMQITGNAKTLEAVNKYTDTLKFTDYITNNSDDKNKAFSSVVLSSFSVGTVTSNSANPTSYTINLKFDPIIFSSKDDTVTLVVPKITSTRSQTEQPAALFKTEPKLETGSQ